MKYRHLLIVIFVGISTIAQAALIDFRYFREYKYTDGTFTANETYFTDISDTGMISGYYKNATGNYVGLIYFQNGKTITYSYTGKTHTEFTGINDGGYVVGRAYNTPSDAIAIRGAIVNGALTNVIVMTWYYTGATFINPKGLSNDGVVSGSIQNGSSRWLNYVSAVPPVSVNGTKRYVNGPNFYNTYGLGISDAVNDNRSCGFYIYAGGENIPFVCGHSSSTLSSFNHANSSIGLPGTKFNDINNNNYVAVTYKTNTGFYQGTVGSANVTINYASYYTSFPFQDAGGSSVLGINNHNDIAGYMTDNAGVTRAYFALSQKNIKIPGYTEPTDVFRFDNSIFNLQKTLNYTGSDPYTSNTNVSFYTDYMLNNPAFTPLDLFEVTNGKTSPTWTQYVMAVSEDSAYVQVSATQKVPKISAIKKWLQRSSDDFQGYCFGMCVMAAQDYADADKLVTRFNHNYVPSLGGIDQYGPGTVYYSELADNLAALHLYQYNNGNYQAEQTMRDYCSSNIQYPASIGWYYDSLRTLVDRTATRLNDTLSSGALEVWAMRIAEIASPGNPFNHAMFPFAISRNPSLTTKVDTIYALDPNVDTFSVKIVVNYTTHVTLIYNEQLSSILYTCKYLYPAGQLSDFHLPDAAILQKSSADNNVAYKTSGTASFIYPDNSCDYTVTNLSNSSEKIIKSGGTITSTFPGLIPDFIMDSDTIPDGYYSNNPISVSAEVAGCGAQTNWAYSHPNGDFFIKSSGGVSSQADVILQTGQTVKVLNTNSNNHKIGVSATTEAGQTEAFVSIDSMILSQNDTSALTSVSMNEYKLENSDLQQHYYNLKVRYITNGQIINRTITDVRIGGNTDHIILIQPNAGVNDKVIILVDSARNNIIDDTIHVVPLSVPLFNKEVTLRVYPNPVKDELFVSLTGITHSWKYVLTDATGKAVYQSFATGNKLTISTNGLAGGLYFLQIYDDQHLLIANKKLIKE